MHCLPSNGDRIESRKPCFLDFARAFPSIPHNKLWLKLFKLGLSSKIIRTLAKIYENANTKVRLGNGFSDAIDMTEGVMQGCGLSPLLFSLYIADAEEVLIKLDAQGIRISMDKQVHILLYADDTVILSPSALGLRMKLRRMEKYFDEHELKVHLDKTKVVIFRRGGRLEKNLSFPYKGEQIGIANEYTYLGVPFSSFCVFHKAAKLFKDKGKCALGATWKVLTRSQLEPFKEKLTLFNTLTKSTFTYCSHIWGLRYLNKLEVIQNDFMRRSLMTYFRTPTYGLRLEFGLPKIETLIIKQALRFRLKLQRMDENRYPKLCYNELMRIAKGKDNKLKHNWVTQINSLTPFTDPDIWINGDLDHIRNCLQGWIDSLFLTSFTSDEERVRISATYSYYEKFNPIYLTPATYLTLPIALRNMRLIAQARLGNGKFYHQQNKIDLDFDHPCKLCGDEANDDIFHMLIDCNRLNEQRLQFARAINNEEELSKDIMMKLLNPLNKEDASALILFLTSCLDKFTSLNP
jgi:hypothetical protein